LRAWRDDDLNSYARICADPLVMRYIGSGAPLTRQQSERQIARFMNHWEERGFGLWAVEAKVTGAFIGRIGLHHHDDWPEGEHKTEVGWLLDRSYWGRGLATEGALASVRHGFEGLGLERVISIAHPANEGSQRVMKKAGLTFQGGTYWRGVDVVWYAIDRGAWKVGERGKCIF
jgi:RimJ/RimL family protein N-acetyltransferase